MEDVPIPPDLEQDPARFDGPNGGRDPERTPMRWDGSPGAGFTTGTPWLPVGGELGALNVAAQRDDPASIARASTAGCSRCGGREAALSIGAWSPLTADGDLLAYERAHAGRRLVVALNLGHGPLAPDLPAAGRVLLSTHLDRDGEAVAGRVELRPDEGVIVEVAG